MWFNFNRRLCRTKINKIRCISFILLFVVMTMWLWFYEDNEEMNSTSVLRSPQWFLQKLGLLRPATHKKWIVVTSINPPTEQIKKLNRIPGWKLLVVADKKTPKNWSHPNVIILDIDAQLKLGYHVLELLPWNSYTRKIIGYLYAIQHGAEFIYDTDDDNAPNNPEAFENDFVFRRTTRGLILNQNDSMVTANPYVHFGQTSVWPRGFPLQYIGQDYNNTYTVCQLKTPIIQQGVVNGDPDVDAIFRLTRKKLFTPLKIQFDSGAPPAIFPTNVLAPFNSQNTIFHYYAFWAMVLPVSVEFRVTDIWRGYWAQPLLWSIGGNLGFYFTNTTQHRNPHVYLRDFGEEDQLYKQAGNLVNFLAGWRCLGHDDLYKCMIELTSVMVDLKMWSTKEIQLMKAWIQDLISVGYKVPSLIKHSEKDSSLCLKGKEKTFAMFNGVEMQSTIMDKFRGPLRKFCNSSTYPAPRTKNQTGEMRPTVFPSTLLVVTFNHPHYENIWLLDLIYRPHYPNILYCGHLENVSILYNLQGTPEFLNANVKKFSFVHGNVAGGGLAYVCALKVIDMKYNVKGYLVLSDDMVLNFWNNWQFNPEETWVHSRVSFLLNTKRPINQTGWHHWSAPYGWTAITAALSDIYNGPSRLNPQVNQFRKNRIEYGYNSSTAMVAESDIFYFPVSKQEMLYEVGSILIKRGVWLEISVPFLITGLSSPNDIVYMSEIFAWKWDSFLHHYNASKAIFHPVKLSLVTERINSTVKLKAPYCQQYVTRVLELEV